MAGGVASEHTGRDARTHARAVPRAACLPSRFPKPPQPIVLRDCQVLPLPPSLPLTHSPELVPGAAPAGPQPRPPTAVDPDAEPTLLRHPQARPRDQGAGVGWARAVAALPAALGGWSRQQWASSGPPSIPTPLPLTGASPAHRSLPRRARWSSPPMSPRWAATLSCSTASSRPTPPSSWRSSSTAAASGRVSGYSGRWGRTPDEGPVGVSATRCGSMAHAAQSTVPVTWLWVTSPHPAPAVSHQTR